MNGGMCSRLRRSGGWMIRIPLRPGHTAQLSDKTFRSRRVSAPAANLFTPSDLCWDNLKKKKITVRLRGGLEWCKTSSGSSHGKHLWDGEDERLSEERKRKHLLSVVAWSKSANWEGVKFISRGKQSHTNTCLILNGYVCHLCCKGSQSKWHKGGK